MEPHHRSLCLLLVHHHSLWSSCPSDSRENVNATNKLIFFCASCLDVQRTALRIVAKHMTQACGWANGKHLHEQPCGRTTECACTRTHNCLRTTQTARAHVPPQPFCLRLINANLFCQCSWVFFTVNQNKARTFAQTPLFKSCVR